MTTTSTNLHMWQDRWTLFPAGVMRDHDESWLLVVWSLRRRSSGGPRAAARLAVLMLPLVLSLRRRSSRSPRVAACRVVLAPPLVMWVLVQLLVGWPSCSCLSCRPHAATHPVLAPPLVVWFSHSHSVCSLCALVRPAVLCRCSSCGPLLLPVVEPLHCGAVACVDTSLLVTTDIRALGQTDKSSRD